MEKEKKLNDVIPDFKGEVENINLEVIQDNGHVYLFNTNLKENYDKLKNIWPPIDKDVKGFYLRVNEDEENLKLEWARIDTSIVPGDLEVQGKCTAQSFNATSDKRLKENVKEFEYKKSILDLPIYTFDFKEGPKNQIGCIAQDLEKIYPELVTKDEKGYLSIQENKLIYLLLEEIKVLKKEVEKLKKRD